MCMAIYIASDSTLPLVPWDEGRPGLYIIELQGEIDEKVRCQFSKPHIYYVGSHTAAVVDLNMADTLNMRSRTKSKKTTAR